MKETQISALKAEIEKALPTKKAKVEILPTMQQHYLIVIHCPNDDKPVDEWLQKIHPCHKKIQRITGKFGNDNITEIFWCDYYHYYHKFVIYSLTNTEIKYKFAGYMVESIGFIGYDDQLVPKEEVKGGYIYTGCIFHNKIQQFIKTLRNCSAW